jgi:hypothetical protein
MNDAIALLAISQLVCIGGLCYLYMQVQTLRRDMPRRRPAPVEAHAPAAPAAARAAQARAANAAYAPRGGRQATARDLLANDAAGVAARLGELGVDVPALARRMGKSEEEVRLLLRRRGIAS